MSALDLDDDVRPSRSTGSRARDAGQTNTTSGVPIDMDMDEDDNWIDPHASDPDNPIRQLMRRWVDERNAPDLLTWRGELVEGILNHLQEQADLVDHFRGHPDTSEEEHFRTMLVQTEAQRVKFVLRSYLRVRLDKIEKFAPFIISNPDIQSNLSELELTYALKFENLVGQHYMVSALSSLPEVQRGLDDEQSGMSNMISQPDKEIPVFVHALRDCGRVRLPDGLTFRMSKGSIHLVQYRTIENLLRNEDAELV